MDQMTTPTTEIAESFRAIQTAATERHAALLREAASLEEMFPALVNGNSNGHTADRVVRTRRRFTAEEKASAVRVCRTSGLNQSQVAKQLGINQSVLRSWVLEADAKDANRQGDRQLVGAH